MIEFGRGGKIRVTTGCRTCRYVSHGIILRCGSGSKYDRTLTCISITCLDTGKEAWTKPQRSCPSPLLLKLCSMCRGRVSTIECSCACRSLLMLVLLESGELNVTKLNRPASAVPRVGANVMDMVHGRRPHPLPPTGSPEEVARLPWLADLHHPVPPRHSPSSMTIDNEAPFLSSFCAPLSSPALGMVLSFGAKQSYSLV